MIEALTLIAAVAVWWSAACRIGQLDRAHHRLAPMIWHWSLSAGCLLSAAQAITGGPDLLALAVCGLGAVYMLMTLPDWADGPPAWAYRRPDAAPAAQSETT